MSTPHTITVVAPRFQIRPATLGTALGVLVAIAVSIVILARTGANHTTATSPVTASQATSGSVPQVHYLGPRQVGAAVNPQATRVQAGGNIANPAASNTVVHHTCLGAAQHCLR